MVKIKTICRDPADYQRQNATQIRRVNRNPSRQAHPFQQARQYVRALNAAKLQKVFAKPFVKSYDGHSDTVNILAKNRNSLTQLLSGACDGEIILWDLSLDKKLIEIPKAHQGFIRGLDFSNTGQMFLSTGDDNLIKIWKKSALISSWEIAKTSSNLDQFKNFQSLSQVASSSKKGSQLLLDYQNQANSYRNQSKNQISPILQYHSKTSIQTASQSYQDQQLFSTGGQVVQFWNYNRAIPIATWNWNKDTVSKIAFNPTETNLLASTSMDRFLTLYDGRDRTPIKRVALQTKSSCLSWNPYEPLNITLGNEDSNCYAFDLRKLQKIKKIYKGHMGAVLDIDFAPTGKQFATGSYDRTVRIFQSYGDGMARQTYHTKRMQRVFSVLYTMDNKFVISGSDDTNIRVWKARASQQLRQSLQREKQKIAYDNKLKQKYKHHSQIKRILRHKHLPKLLWKQKNMRQEKLQRKKRKQRNVLMNTRRENHPIPGASGERTTKIVQVDQ